MPLPAGDLTHGCFSVTVTGGPLDCVEEICPALPCKYQLEVTTKTSLRKITYGQRKQTDMRPHFLCNGRSVWLGYHNHLSDMEQSL